MKAPTLYGWKMGWTRWWIVWGIILLCAGLRAEADTALVFNEIMYHPQTNEPALEWVEFYNQMAVDLDVSGWSLANGIDYKFPAGTIVRGGGYVVVAISPANLMAATGLTNVLGPFTGRLSNGGETLEVRNNDGRIMDSVNYGVEGDWPVAPDGSGVSLAKLDPNTASGPAENWAMSEQVGGTPGRTNFPNANVFLNRSLALNEISAATNAVFWLELFNFGTNDLALEGYRLTQQGSSNNSYVFSSGQTLTAGSFLSLDQTQLGFRPASADKLFLYSPLQDQVWDAVVVKDRLRGRSPDGTGELRHPDQPTPGASNHFAFHTEIVINEIMYDHFPTQSVSGLQPSAEQWLELYNRSSNSVDLTGWRLDGGIQYSFTNAQTIGPGGYLVVAKQSAALRLLYPSITIVGDFSKNLSRHDDEIVLKDPNDDPADKVHYYDKAPWPSFANKGGSSLELRDPWADNSKAQAWAASDETTKSFWSNYTYTTVAAIDGGPTQWNEFVLGLLAQGECLVDDISVLELPTNHPPVQLVANGDFENGVTGWRVLGNHNRTRVEVDPDNGGNHVLHVVATGPTEHMHNHVETTYIGNRTITNGNTYQVSFKAKWLGGVNLLNTRLYFNRIHRTTALPMPALNGSPGARNSRFETNIGPTFSQFQHRPIVPNSNQTVTVTMRADDPQGVSSCKLWWSANGGSWSNSAMALQGNGLYTASIPAQPAATVVQFYVEGTDGLGAVSTFPARGQNSRALYKVDDGQANLSLGHNIRVVMTPPDVALLTADTNLMSNDNLGATVICDEQHAYYDMTLRLKSSERGRLDPARVGLHLTFNSDHLFRGIHPVMLVDRSGVEGGFGQTEIIVKHMMNHAGGIPQVYNDLSRVLGPVDSQAGSCIFFPRFEDVFLGDQYPGGADGTLYEYELIYYPLTTSDGTPTGYKLPQPDEVLGVDISDLGNDKEDYRYHYIIKNNREVDDYSTLIDLCKVFSLTNSSLDAQSQRVMDVDEWLRTFVMEALCGVDEIYNAWNDDNLHNVLLYVRSSDNKMVTFPWDADWCFVAPYFSGLYGNRNLSKIITIPANLRASYAHALDMMDTTFNRSYMDYWISHYNQFCPGQDFSTIGPYIDNRVNFLRANLGPFSTNTFALRGTNNFVSSSDFITVTGAAPVQVSSILFNGLAYPVTWLNLTNWAVTLAVLPGTNVFQIQGLDLHGNVLSNANLSLTVNYTGTSPNPQEVIVINEIMYNPAVPGASFVELFNTSSNFAFDVTGWRLDGVDFTFPPMIMTNRQILVIAKDLNAFTAAYGTAIQPAGVFDGRLEVTGETLSLIKPGLTPEQDLVIDRVRYEPGAPWPPEANGTGGSLQLIDASQDNSRVSNWAAAPSVSTPGTVNSFVSALPAYPLLWINEIQADNLNGLVDNQGQREPWIELYNAGSQPLSLDGFFLANNYTNLAQWSFPTGIVINAGDFKVIFADGQPEQSTATELHTSFRLASTTGALALSRTLSNTVQLVDYMNYSDVHSNLSFGAFPDGQPFYRQELYFVTPGAPNNGASPPSGVFINEWMASNTGFIRDPADNALDDWFELYNPGTSPVNLAGYYLTDNLADKFQYRIPAGYVVPALGFLLVWADNTPSQNSPTRPDLHVNFALSKGGEMIGLFAPDGTQIDAVLFGPQTNNVSQGRYPDGTASIYFMTNPTPRSANIPPFNNRAPVLQPIGNQSIVSGQTLSLTISATDTDQPPQTLTFSLDAGAPDGATIDGSSGLLQWTPSPSQVPSTNTIRVRVTDNGTPNLSATRTFQVFVYRVNSAPTLPVIDDRTIMELTALSVTNTASDPDFPDTVLNYSLMAAPPGVGIDTNGIITWIPNEAQGPGTYVLTTVVTDNGYPALSATNSFNVVVQEVNSAPVLPNIPNQTVVVSTLLTVTNTAADIDLPQNAQVYSLVSPPDGASIDGNGIITWTPSQAQVRTTNLIVTVVTDDSPNAINATHLSATNSFTVFVQEVNVAPVLPAVQNRTMQELTSLTVTNTATDANIPAQTLTYAFTGPAGAQIDTNGIITWFPSEAQGPSTNTFTTVVTDNGLPNKSSTNVFTVVVQEVNSPPTLPSISDRTMNELTLLTVTNTASDVDLPPNHLTYSLVNPPAGASIDTNGVITWFASEAQGPGTNIITTIVTDNGSPSLSATNKFTVTVLEVNSAPVLPVIPDQTVMELAHLSVTNRAVDTDIPFNSLTYALVNPPDGMAIDANGVISWTPTEAQGPGTNVITTTVVDNGVPNLHATNTFAVVVLEVNSAPVLAAIANRTVDELTLLTVTNSASDADLPHNIITYSLLEGPEGASIDTNGVITWTPSEAQGPGTYALTTRAADNGTPSLSATNSFTVQVREVNQAPVLAAVSNRSVNEGTLLSFTNSATDPDLPANTWSFELAAGAPAGASVNPTNGVFTWTPTEAQGPSNYVITVRVTDNGTPPLSDTKSFTVTVNEVNSAPVLGAIGNKAVTNGGTLTFTASATDSDLPANTLRFSLDPGAPTGASINATNGVFSWTPSGSQGPGGYSITVRVTDNGTPALSDAETFLVTVFSTNIHRPLLVITNLWKYDQSGANLGTNWRTTDFDDSAWPSGLALLYHETAGLPAPKNTPLDLTNHAGQYIITFYFRTHFFLPSDVTGVTLTASNLIDDGAVFYLNGVEAARYNMPTGAISNTNFASTIINNATTYIVTNLATGSLNAGDNVIAVEVHQANSNSTDVVFGMSLTASIPPQGGVAITNQPADLTVFAGQSAEFAVGASGSSLRYQWYKNGSPINGANGPTFLIPAAASSDAGNYSVVVSNLVSVATSRTATLTVLLPNTPPVLANIPDRTVNEGVLLNFTATATDAEAPPQTLTFSLEPGAPAGATVTAGGSFSWTPTEAQGPGAYPITMRVTDNGTPSMSDTQTFTVTVKEVNTAPVLPVIADRTMTPLVQLTVTNTANDSDLPANSLTYTLVSPPPGATIDTNGIISWFPLESDSPGTYTFTTIVRDHNPDAINAQELSATNHFAVTVQETRRLFTLSTAADSGTITLSPPGGHYPSNTLVHATAQAAAGWTFLGWRGDLGSELATESINMDRNKFVRALFGTTLSTHVVGDGTILLYPTNQVCAFGSTVTLVAIPGSNSFLSKWNFTTGSGITNTTTVNPLRYTVVDPTVLFEAVFETLDAGQVTLTVIPDGRGQVIATPAANHYNLGDTVNLQAVPDPSQKFISWTGDETSASSNLDVTLTRSKTVTAHFSKGPFLEILASADRLRMDGALLNLTGDAGTDYEIQGSADLHTWTPLGVVNSPFGLAQYADLSSTNFPRRFYRSVSPPGYVAPPPATLVSTGSFWKYLDNGSNQGTNWVSLGFNDSGWALGPAQLGYGDGDEATVVSFGGNEANKYITTYFRHYFTVTNASLFASLTARLLRDDGAVVYLNGREVWRSNMPNGPITYLTLASTSGVEDIFFRNSFDPALLLEGVNVLAVEVHQVSPDSSDISFDFELIGQSQ